MPASLSRRDFEVLTREDYIQLCNNFWITFRDHAHLKYEYAFEGEKVSSTYSRSIRNLMKINFDNPKHRRKAYSLLFCKAEPFLIEALKYSEVSKKVTSFKTNIYFRRMKRLRKATESILFRTKTPTHTDKLFNKVNVPHTAVTTFELATPFPEITTHLKKVAELSVLARTYQLQPEDEYVVEQIQQNHLPHIAKSSKGFKLANSTIKEGVIQQYTKQLEVMESKLSAIINQNISGLFRETSVQTDFLEERLK